jgi:mRNA interferase MazF
MPRGSAAAFRRPVIVVQSDALNRTALATVVCIPLTTNIDWAEAPGNVFLSSAETSLQKDSVANASQILAVDRHFFLERAGTLSRINLDRILAGIDIILGR